MRRKAVEETYETEEERRERLQQKVEARLKASQDGSPIPPGLDWRDDETTDLFETALASAKAVHDAGKRHCKAAVKRWSLAAKRVAEG